jgi:hypothetical protein
MNKIAQLAAATIIILALAGCTPRFAKSAPTPVARTVDVSYVAAVRAAAPTLDKTPAGVLITSGKGTCSAMDDGHSAEELSTRAVAYGLTADEGTAIIRSAVDAFCPEHAWISSP